MNEQITKVSHFMEDMNQTVRYDLIRKLSKEERRLKVALVAEELRELSAHLGVDFNFTISEFVQTEPLDPPTLLQDLCDLLYVTFGAVCTLGLQPYITPGFDELHKSNMSKRQPDGTVLKNEYGKVKKPAGYRPPDFAEVIAKVRYEQENTP